MKYFQDLMQPDFVHSLIKRLILAAIVFGIGTILIHLLIQSLQKLLFKGSKNQKKKTMFTVFSSFAKYLIYFFTLMIILEIFGISTSSIVAVAGVGSVALGLGAQVLVKDMISGLFILTEDQYNVEDVVEIAGYAGTVEEMSLRTTTLRTAKGELCIIPNGEIRAVKNFSKDYLKARVDLPISYDANTEEVMAMIATELSGYEKRTGVLEKPEVLGILEYADSAVVIRVQVKCLASEKWAIERELRIKLKDMMDQHHIEIPYQTSTVYVKHD